MGNFTFYKDTQRRLLRHDLFSTEAEHLASTLANASKEQNKRSQIRKFYDEVLRLNTLAKVNDKEWDNILPYIHMLIAKAAYAEGRKLVSSDFVEFMKGCIKQIETQRDLEIFADFFESLMGFYRQHRQS